MLMKKYWTWILVGMLCMNTGCISMEKKQRLRIACVGDSITYGTYLHDPTKDSYPAQLQRLLTEQAIVKNFGVSGTSVCLNSDVAYWNQEERIKSGEFLPDIVLIMLGTNDSMDAYWQDKGSFFKDYEVLIQYYKNLASHPKVYVLTPSSSFILNGNDDLVRGMHQERIHRIAAWLNTYVSLENRIDIHEVTRNVPQFYTMDGVHPNAQGAHYIANVIYQFLKEQHRELS